MAIPSLPPATTQQTFFRGFAQTIEGQFNPATTSTDNLVPLANAMTAPQLAAPVRAAAFTGLVHVDHPGKNSPNTIDCASCHLATPVAQLIAAPQFSLIEASDPDAFTPDGTYVLPSETSPTFDTTGAFNVHAFSYVDASPAINQRVVNETAAIVAYMNRL